MPPHGKSDGKARSRSEHEMNDEEPDLTPFVLRARSMVTEGRTEDAL